MHCELCFVLFFASAHPCLPTQAYIGFTWRSGKGFEEEVARWALCHRNLNPAITRLDGRLISNLQDLLDLGFGSRCLIIHLIRAPNSHLLQVETLHRSTFAFNCRVLETELHRSFKTSTNRLWANVGSGSYFLKDEDIKVRCRCFVRIYSHSCSRFKRTTRSSAACLLYMRRALQPLSCHSAANYRYLCVHMSNAPCAIARWSATIRADAVRRLDTETCPGSSQPDSRARALEEYRNSFTNGAMWYGLGKLKILPALQFNIDEVGIWLNVRDEKPTILHF